MAAITQAQIQIVKSTVPILKEHGKTITTVFYNNMLVAHPELKNHFSLRSQVTGAQPEALARSVLAYATYIDDLPKIRHAVERIAHKHASLSIKPEHYPIVGTHLIGAIGQVLGSALTDEIKNAWVAAYGVLADVFVKREEQLYAEAGDWPGWRKFKIVRKEAESAGIVSFYFEPEDGKLLPGYLPGQYISLQVPVPGKDFYQSRQFSLVEAPQKTGMKQYRISVKKEFTDETASMDDLAYGKAPGLISNILHNTYNVGDVVELSFPRGEFFVEPTDVTKAAAPLVLLSRGVGAAPLNSIFDAVLASPTASRPISWIHGARDSDSALYLKHVREEAAKRENITATVALSNVRDGDKLGEQYDVSGRLDLESLSDALHLSNDKAEYFVCGPEDWMIAVRSWLSAKGVDVDRQHYELFGTGDI